MKKFIPHKNNSNKAERVIGIIVIMGLSSTIVFFGKGYVEEYVSKAQAVQLNENISIQKNTSVNEEQFLKSENLPDESAGKAEEIIEIKDSEQMAITVEEAKAEIPKERGRDPKQKLAEAKNFAKPQISEGKYIDVSLAHQNMVLFENGEYVDAYLISSGKKGMETPLGTFKIENKVPRAWSKTYGLFMPNWMAITPSGKFGIHELPEWPGGYKEGADHLGYAVSHGCVRLGIGDSKKVYDWAEIGTPIIVHK